MTISVPQAQLFFLAFTRIMAIIIHVPVFGGQTIPNQVRIGLGLVLALVLIPWQPLPPEAETLGFLAYSLSIGKEILIGTLVGFAADLAFGAIQVAGAAMGLGSGFESGRIFNPTLGDSGSAFDQVFVMTATMIFLVINGHHLVLIALQKTFEILPLNGALPFNGLEIVVRTTAAFITAGIQMALPVMTALILADLTLGLPVKVAVALLALGMTFSVISPSLVAMFRSMPEHMLLFLGK